MPLVTSERPCGEGYLSVAVSHHMDIVTNTDVTTMNLDVPGFHQHWVCAERVEPGHDEVADIPLLELTEQVLYP